jgi:alkylation response protein AidB-like acyl-CoA dehydrogenase
LLLRPATALADLAAQNWSALSEKGRWSLPQSEVRLRSRSQKQNALRTAQVLVSSQMFELTGASSTSSRYGYDRFWRNVRVHTLHDPIDYKLRDLGRYALNGSVPEPTAYS